MEAQIILKMLEKSQRNKNIYKAYEPPFESLKQKSRKNYYISRLEKYQNYKKKSRRL